MVTNVIRRPQHVPGIGARTPEEYRALQIKYLRKTGNPTEPWVSQDPIAAHVGAGAWRVWCPCGEAPPADPEWRLACCSGCGAIHDQVEFPEEREEIERVLLKRPNHAHRNWQAGETIDGLRRENLAHGDPA